MTMRCSRQPCPSLVQESKLSTINPIRNDRWYVIICGCFVSFANPHIKGLTIRILWARRGERVEFVYSKQLRLWDGEAFDRTLGWLLSSPVY